METQQDKEASFFRFEDLRIYDKASDYADWLISHLQQPQTAGDQTLVESFCRSAFDISLNIAEGSSRTKNHFEHYLKIAKTAVRECTVFTTMAYKRRLFDEECRDRSRESLMEMTRMIGALIISLQRNNPRRDDRYNDNPPDDDPIDELDSIETNF